MREAAPSDEKKPFLPRWAIYLMLPGVVGPVLVLAFVFVTEYAHDERRCPYQPVTERAVAPLVLIREEMRRCLPGVEEHRFTAVRGKQEYVLGRRRFAAGAFAAEHYHWDAKLSGEGEVHLTVHNDGHPEALFREGTAAERAQELSKNGS